jgi:hypothetical protein
MFGKNNFRQLKPLKILFFVVVFFTVVTAVIWVVMFLWNTILTEVTSVNPLNFWQAGGLLLLAKILFGGFGGRKGGRHHKGKEWKNKWMNMNNEERQEMKARWKARCEKKGSE